MTALDSASLKDIATATAKANGPIAVIIAEDSLGIEDCVQHHSNIGFSAILLFAKSDMEISSECTEICTVIPCDPESDLTAYEMLNPVIEAAAGNWLYFCFNAEYLFFPFSESRSIREMIEFVNEERRTTVFTSVIDLYPDNLEEFSNGYSPENAYFDRSGYYAQHRMDEINHPLERQLEIYGGLKWRYEEFVPKTRRRMDRIGLFLAKKGLRMGEGFLFNDVEYNTYACEWHHNVSAAICSFRAAKYLRSIPASAAKIHSFMWSKSSRFEWNSQQLMDHGLMEPGQWF